MAQVRFDEETFGLTECVHSVAVGVSIAADTGEICLAVRINDINLTFDDDVALHGLVRGINEMWPEVLRRREEAKSNG